MGANSKIEWTDATWTPIRARNKATGKVGWHCVHDSPGCQFCYAEGLNQRLGTGLPFKPGHEKDIEIFLDETMLLAPLRWKKPRMIFVCSMTDLFGGFVSDEMIDKVFAVMGMANWHIYQVLTKRSARMRAHLSDATLTTQRLIAAASAIDHPLGAEWNADFHCGHDKGLPLRNVWLGVSAEDQRRADERIPDLLATPAAVRFVSAEPLLGPIDFRQWMHAYGCGCGWGGDSPHDYCAGCGWRGYAEGELGDAACPECKRLLTDYNACPECDGHDGDGMSFGPNSGTKLDWIIAGGESGPHARPMHPDWARSIRDQCAAVSAPFFFKRWGEFIEFDPRPEVELITDGTEKAQQILDLCHRPSWVQPDGRHILRRDDLPEQGEPGARLIERVGKRRAGRLLDGVEHNAMPEARR